MSHMAKATVVKSVRLQQELLDRLDARAQLEHRTVNNLIAKLLTEALDEPIPNIKDTTSA